MGYAFVLGACGNCGNTFTFNPVKVPSVRDSQGIRQPICQECMTEANKQRADNGIQPFTIPDDAYTFCDENELG